MMVDTMPNPETQRVAMLKKTDIFAKIPQIDTETAMSKSPITTQLMMAKARAALI